MTTCIKFIKLVIGLFIVIFLSACSANHSYGNSDNQPSTGITLLKIITQLRLAVTYVISSYISVDGGARQVMVVNGANASCNFNLYNKQVERVV